MNAWSYARPRIGPALVICLIALFVLAAGSSSAAEPVAKTSDAVKPYCPFDEPTPKIPQEILSDPRLDVRVKVFVKSRNLKDFFQWLSDTTGVKIAASREIWGDRPIVYFHDRPLRDVMTEISGLYGYHWLVKGKKGEHSYELFEDMRHAEKRGKLDVEQNERQYSLLSSLLDKAVRGGFGDEALQRLKQRNPDGYEELVTPPYSTFGKLLLQFGESFRRSIYDTPVQNMAFADLSPESQAAMLVWQNEQSKWTLNDRLFRWLPSESPLTYGMDDMQSAQIRFRRVGDLTDIPRFWMMMDTKRESRAILQWPPWRLETADLWDLACPDGEIVRIIGDVDLPNEPEVSAKTAKYGLHEGGDLLFGDVLQAIAEQSDYDIIADYYLQYQDTMNVFEKEPLGKLVNALCRRFDYTCQPEGSTLRFRCNNWFDLGVQVEPPPELIERLWKRIETAGSLSLDDILYVAGLPKPQAYWRGFAFIPGANLGQQAPTTFRLLSGLGPALRSAARDKDGLPVSFLASEQAQVFSQWAGIVCAGLPPEGIAAGVLNITYLVEGGTAYETKLTIPDGTSKSVRTPMPEPLNEHRRKILCDQRRADLAADRVEITPE